MPVSPLTTLAKIPERLLPIPVDRNQPPIPRPTSRTGASLVTIDRPIGDRHNSPTTWTTYVAISVQNGILPSSLTRFDSANISSRNARPLNIRPRPNFRGIDGFNLRRASHTQSQATTGASTMTASAETDWNQAVGKTKLPSTLSTIWSARKVNELPACS